MKIRVLSDLHLEFSFPELESGEEDMIVLAGDIWTKPDVIRWARETFVKKTILFVPGNHDYYHSVMEERAQAFEDEGKRYNVMTFIKPGDHEIIDGILFVGGTFWTDMSYRFTRAYPPDVCKRMALEYASGSMSDYQVIRKADNTRLRPHDTVRFHNEQFEAMKKLIENYSGDKIAVVTHHPPSVKSTLLRYHTDPLTPAFVNTKEEWILDNPKIKLWISGHTHNHSDYMIGECRCVGNPRGYVTDYGRMEQTGFRENFVVEV